MRYETINFGTKENLKTLKLGTCCTKNLLFIALFKQLEYVLTHTYEDIKTYGTNII